MNGESGYQMLRRWLMERVERTSARRGAEELELNMPALIAELYSHGEIRPEVLEATNKWFRDNDICLSAISAESGWGTERKRWRMIEELCAEGVNLRMVSGTGGPKAELVDELGADEVATLPGSFA